MAHTEKSADRKADKTPVNDGIVIIKKYANRRLYDTGSSRYVTMDNLATMVRDGVDFVVRDAKTDEDITRSVLTHIIVEQEGKEGQNLLPISFLRHLISFYGDSLQSVVPGYLEHAMQTFSHNQEKMRDYMCNTFGELSPFNALGQINRHNQAMFEQSMNMFNPFMGASDHKKENSDASDNYSDDPPVDPRAKDEIIQLREQLDEMKKRLDNMG